jgi:hypothetical protein
MMVRYSVCGPADINELAQVLAETFTEHDPPAVAAGLTRSEFETFAHLLGPRAATEGLTIVARSASTGDMMGALLAEDSAAPFPDGRHQLSPKFDPIFDILGQLDAEYTDGRPAPSGQSLHLVLLGVGPPFMGHGVAQGLVAACLETGTRKGYRIAVTEATNNVSQHIFRKQGFVDRVRRSYRDHRFDGQAVFASITEHAGPILMDKVIG